MESKNKSPPHLLNHFFWDLLSQIFVSKSYLPLKKRPSRRGGHVTSESSWSTSWVLKLDAEGVKGTIVNLLKQKQKVSSTNHNLTYQSCWNQHNSISQKAFKLILTNNPIQRERDIGGRVGETFPLKALIEKPNREGGGVKTREKAI